MSIDFFICSFDNNLNEELIRGDNAILDDYAGDTVYTNSSNKNKLVCSILTENIDPEVSCYCDTRACHPTTHTTNRATGLSDSAIDTFGPEATGSNLPSSGVSPHYPDEFILKIRDAYNERNPETKIINADTDIKGILSQFKSKIGKIGDTEDVYYTKLYLELFK